MPERLSGLRVFVSYSHTDSGLFEDVCKALRDSGVEPWSDVRIRAGGDFMAHIQTFIAHSHVFVPVLTSKSHARGWIHQEIGYALALGIPCVPICIGTKPDGMIAMSQAVVVPSDLSELPQRLAAVDFKGLATDVGQNWLPAGNTAMEPEDRALLTERHANEALRLAGPMVVRIQGGLSVFSIPDRPPGDPAWDAIYGVRKESRPTYSREARRRERQALERHANAAGVRLILHTGLDLDAHYGPGSKRARLRLLVEFLESLALSADQVQIALPPEEQPGVVIGVGDWFVAKSLAVQPVRGVLQTVFVTHAPTLTRDNNAFDRELTRLAAVDGIRAEESRAKALTRLHSMIEALPESPAWPG